MASGSAVAAKTRAEEYWRSAAPSSTILRPCGLRSDPATGRAILSLDPQIHGFINREDVAELIFRVLGDPATSGQSFAAVEASMAQSVNVIIPFELRAMAA